MSIDLGDGSRGKYTFKNGKFVPFIKPKVAEVHNIIVDEMEPIQSMAVFHKQIFTSKSAYRRHLKAHGYVETGGEHLKDYARLELEHQRKAADEERLKEIRDTVERAVMDVKYDRVEFTESEKATFEKEKEKWNKDYILKNPY